MKRIDVFIEAILLLVGYALGFGELVAEFLDGFFETRDFAF